MVFNRVRAAHRMRGFTLIEALVATLIVALSLVAVTTKVSLAAKVAKRTHETTFGRWVAMNAITELRLKPGLPDVGRSDGDEEMAGIEWRWTMDISKTPVEGLRRIDIEIAHASTPDKTLYSMAAFIGNNTPGETLRPWSGWPDADGGSGDQNAPPTLPGAPVLPGQRPDPRRGLDRPRSQ